ncbi:MAG: cytochrome c [Myxococcales bacterium]|nr:cytochrome c [Myxococcales bacterium]MCB9629587.1 cytochrome c [Sandaracinaceae bacterium]
MAFLAYRVYAHYSAEEQYPVASEGPPRGRTLEEWGAYLYDAHGCAACHSIAGVRGVGGSLDRIMGQTRHFTDGSDGVVDADYLRESIITPQRKVVMGFSGSMPRYDFRDDEVNALVAYLSSI